MQFRTGDKRAKEVQALINQFKVSQDKTLGKSLNADVVPTNHSSSYYGFVNRFKNLGKAIHKIQMQQKSIAVGAEYRCKILSDDRTKVLGYTTATTKKADGALEVIDFIFATPVTVPDANFYVSVYSPTVNNFVTDFHNSDSLKSTICSGTSDSTFPTYYFSSPENNGTGTYEVSPKNSYYMFLEFFWYEENILPLDGTITTSKFEPVLKNNIDTLTGFVKPQYNSMGKTLTSDEIPTINNGYYGFVNRLKKPSKPVTRITLRQTSPGPGSEYRCKILNDARTATLGYATATTKAAAGVKEYVEFIFTIPITITEDNFYVSVYSPTTGIKVDAYSGNGYNNTLVTSADATHPTYFFQNPETNGIGAWATSPVDGYYALIELYSQDNNILPVDESIEAIKLSKGLKSSLKLYDKLTQSVFMPNKVYTWGDALAGDYVGDRVPKVGVYLDHALPWGHQVINGRFDGATQKNKLEFYTPYPIDYTLGTINNSVTKQEIVKPYTIKGDNINDVTGSITQVSVRNDVGPDQVVRLLTIGDSTVAGANSFTLNKDGTKDQGPFWHRVARMFAKDSISVNDVNKYKFLALGTRLEGTNNSQGGSEAVTYMGVTRNIFTATNGFSGTKLADHLRYVSSHRPDQATWDLLGLGNGSGTDYTGTAAQMDLIAQTCEVYTGTEAAFSGSNPFFDQNKTGNNRFSIAKWLERYRTHDDSGNKLTVGAGTGTKVSSGNIDKMNVCTPTHVLLQTGLNDWSQVSLTQYIADMNIFINEVKTQLPGAKIAITLFPDDPGTYFPELYPNISESAMRYLHDRTRPYVKALQDNFGSTPGVDLLPFYFVMPPAVSISYRWLKNDDGEFVKVPFGPASNDYHANGYAHSAWAHQLYGWIKSTLA